MLPADLVVPIFSFSYCGIGLVLIVMSIRQCDAWSKAYHLKLLEVLDEYFDHTASLTFRWLWSALDGRVSELEFRVFHNIFCDSYKIQRSAFAFDEYVEKVFDKFVLSIIEIRPVDWLLLAAVILLNLARRALDLNYSHCAAGDAPCEHRNSTVMFTIAGAAIFVLTCVLVVSSRRLELAIMAKKGIPSREAYPAYLQYMEEQKDVAEDATRLNVEELKVCTAVCRVAVAVSLTIPPSSPPKTRRTACRVGGATADF